MFSFINIFGLSIAMAVSLVLILMLADQKEYDQFNVEKDNIYRVLTKRKDSSRPNASSPYPLAKAMADNYSFVENATNLLPGVGGDVFSIEEDQYAEMRGFFTDQKFFKIFNFELMAGNKNTALKEPNSMIITSDKARQLFRNQNPIGNTVRFSSRGLPLIKMSVGGEKETNPVDWGLFTITGVLDSKRFKSHLKFDVLISATSLPRLYNEEKLKDLSENWREYSRCYTYLLLEDNTSNEALQSALDEVVVTRYKNFPNLAGMTLISQKLNEINPGQFLGNPTSLRLPIVAYQVLSILALMLVFSACFNYTNLSIARVFTRIREIGVRKVNGAAKKDLMFQFLIESIVISLLALVLANLVVILLKFAFANIWIGSMLNFDLAMNLRAFLYFLAFSTLAGVLFGFYPSLVFSKFSTMKALKTNSPAKSGKIGMRMFLNISQFVFSLVFIITSIIIAQQYNHINNLKHDFNSENIINIPIQGNDYQILVNEFNDIPGIQNISACQLLPGMTEQNGISVKKSEDSDEKWNGEINFVNESFIQNLGLELITLKSLGGEFKSNRVLVNEYTVKTLGFESPESAIGQTIFVGEKKTIIGVFKDFNFQSAFMGNGKMPLILSNVGDRFNYLNLDIGSTNLKSTVNLLNEKWKTIDSIHPFKYFVYEDQIAATNLWIRDIVSIVSFITTILVVISCLGLLGITVYKTERQTKEVGIRKVIGASQVQLLALLSRSFVRLLIKSMILAVPMSYFINSMWLDNFPNRVALGFEPFIIGVFLIVILVFLTVGFQIISISRTNPTKILRVE